MKKEYIIISGGFDPIHSGHIDLISNASKIANVIAILNNDNFLINKKGYIFMNVDERMRIISSITGVDEVFLSIDNDHTVNKSIEYLSKNKNIKYFGNGGDRNFIQDIPESNICKKNHIELLFNIGGEKSQSSSSLANSLYDQMLLKEKSSTIIKKPWGFYKTLISDSEYLLKKIYINPNEEISEQSHNYRDEHWVVVSGEVLVQMGKDEIKKKTNEHIFIPKKLKHKITNEADQPAIIVEVQTGVILSETDIIRYKDKYNRS
jgi:cytidyltransferase-like protein